MTIATWGPNIFLFVPVGLLHLQRSVSYGNDDDAGKNSIYEQFFTSNSQKVQTITFHPLPRLSHRLFFFMAQQPLVVVMDASSPYSLKHTIRGWSLWRVISSMHRPIYLTTHDTPNRQPCPGRIRTRNSIKQTGRRHPP